MIQNEEISSLFETRTLSKNCVPVMEPSLLSVRHSTKMSTSKLELHSSLQPHFMHMYFSMELLPMPAGACNVLTH